MKPKTAKLLLIFYFFVPVGGWFRPLVAVTLLSQIEAIYLAQQAQKKLDQEDDDGAIEEFFRALCLAPSNTAALAYLGLFRNCPVFLNYENGGRITSRGFTLAGQTSPDETVQFKITSTLPLLGGLFGIGNETVVEQGVNADENGCFQIQVPAPSRLPSGTRYTVRASIRSEHEWTEPAQITLVQQ